MPDNEIKIIGAGLSGLAAASVLTNAGYKVNLIERSSRLGVFRGQDFQVIRNYGDDLNFCKKLAENGIKIYEKKPIRKIIKYAPSGKSMMVHSENGPLFYVVKRGEDNNSLDNQIFKSIKKEKLNIEFNRNANVLSGDIIATGPVLKNLAGFGYTFDGIDIDDDAILFFMDNNYAPNGYIYVSPYGRNSASIAAVSFDLNVNLKVLLDNFLNENKVAKKLFSNYSKKEVFSGFALCNYPESAEINGKLFTGAAAGFVEAARGFGVKYSILSGILAAKSIIENENYDKLWKEEFGKELIESLSRHFLLADLNNKGLEKLILSEKVKIKDYKKIPSSLSKILGDIKVSYELKYWQNQYSLNKMFSTKK